MSKKPSDTSTPLLEPPRVIFLDENLSSPKIGELLRHFPHDWQVELYYDHFEPRKPDLEIIEICGQRGWVLVSCDDRIRTVAINRAAVNRHQVYAFMFPKGNYHWVDYSAALIVARHSMISLMRKTAPPMCARIFINGQIKPLFQHRPPTEMTSRERTALKYGQKVINGDD